MAARYQLKVVTDFASAHTLRDYPGACSRMHGHNWKVELEAVATELDEVGMGIVPDNAMSRRFRDWAGSLNQQMAQCAHEVILTVAGIPVSIKSAAPEGSK